MPNNVSIYSTKSIREHEWVNDEWVMKMDYDRLQATYEKLFGAYSQLVFQINNSKNKQGATE